MTTAWQCMVLDCALGRGTAVKDITGTGRWTSVVWTVSALCHTCRLQCRAATLSCRKTLVSTGFWPQWRRCNGQWGRPCEHTWLRLLKVLPPLTPKSTSDGSGDFSMKRKLKHSGFLVVFFLISVIERDQTACVLSVVVWEFYHVCPLKKPLP